MKKVLSLLLIASTFAAQSQIVSKFTWTSMPLTTAAVGPNATSVSNSATSVNVGGSIGYALNPGLPNKNVNLVIPGSPTFDIPAIDIDLYFRREESVASFFKRGSLFNFGMNNGQLTIIFSVSNGAGGSTTINSGNIVPIADDHAFHHYCFKYDNNTGVANVYVDDVIKYTYNGTAGRPLYWTGSGNAIVGEEMDATSRNIGVLANLTVQNPSSNITLPVKLLSFSASAKHNTNTIKWSTTQEINASSFVIERSANSIRFSAIGEQAAKGTFETIHQYQATDDQPISGTNYYRLKMVDADGTFTYSEVVKVKAASEQQVSCFPNPAIDQVNLQMTNAQAGAYTYIVTTLTGRIIKSATVQLNSSMQQINVALNGNTPSGMLMIRLQNTMTNEMESFKVMKM